MSLPPAAVITDIEGTTTPIDFVHDKLFPYARARLAAFCAAHRGAAVLADVPEPALETLLGWMDRDEKITALKSIQGMIWEDGYRTGALKAELYPDVPAALNRWSKAGLRLFVYSSGSVPAQKLLFGHSDSGDLTPLFDGFFDTRSARSAKWRAMRRSAAAPISRPAKRCSSRTSRPSWMPRVKRACAPASWCAPQDGTKPAPSHDTAADFTEVAAKFGLPRG